MTDSRDSMELSPLQSSQSGSLHPPWWRDPSRIAAIITAAGLRLQELWTSHPLIEEWTLALTLVAAVSGGKLTSALVTAIRRARERRSMRALGSSDPGRRTPTG